MATNVKKARTHGRWLCSKAISFTVEGCWWTNTGCSQQPTAKWGRFCKGRQGKSLWVSVSALILLSLSVLCSSLCVFLTPLFGSLDFPLCSSLLLCGFLARHFLSLSLLPSFPLFPLLPFLSPFFSECHSLLPVSTKCIWAVIK